MAAEALPHTRGLASGGAFGISPCSTSSTLSGEASMLATVSRLQWQPSANSFQGSSRRSCQRARPPSLRANVLDEEQLPARPQHPRRLGQRRARIGHRAEDQGEDGGVEAGVLERQPFGGRFDQLGTRSRLGQPATQPLGHVRVGLGQHQPLEAVGKEADVGAGAGADVDRPATRLGERLPPQLAQPRILGPLEEPVVEGREGPSPGRVVDPSHAGIVATN